MFSNGSSPTEINEILIVEDDRDFVDDLLACWRPSLPVSHAASGREAVEYLQSSHPSLVLLDLNLPHYLSNPEDLEGLSILSYIREQWGSELPVIVITGERATDIQTRVSSLGAQGFFAKPFEVSEFEQTVWTVMQGGQSAFS